MTECPYGASACPKIAEAESEISELKSVIKEQTRKVDLVIVIVVAIHGLEILTALGLSI